MLTTILYFLAGVLLVMQVYLGFTNFKLKRENDNLYFLIQTGQAMDLEKLKRMTEFVEEVERKKKEK